MMAKRRLGSRLVWYQRWLQIIKKVAKISRERFQPKSQAPIGTAQSPRMAPYTLNKEGARTPNDAIILAKSKGIEIPDDILIVFLKNWKKTGVDAEYFYQLRTYQPDDWVYWDDFYHPKTGKIPVRFNEAILNSDEHIVALIAHEMYELNSLRQIEEEENGQMPARHLSKLITSGIASNLHDKAWDIADELVRTMREKS